MAARDHVDASAPPRPGEELDRAVLESLMRAELPGVSDAPLVVEQFPSGHSNLTYLLRIGEREWVLRRPPFGAHARGGHDMGREFRILSKVHDVYPQAPRPLLFVDDPSVVGDTFYVMERIVGVILRATAPAGLDLGPATMRGLSESFVDNLVAIHAVGWEAAGLGELRRPGNYVERQIDGWTSRWHDSQTDAVPAMDDVAAWLAANMPPERGATLIHNDFKYDNLVLDPDDLTRIVGVLDWEMATIGDPLMDLGSSLGYWVEADDPPDLAAGRFGETQLPGNFTRREIVRRYGQLSGRDIGDVAFYYAYALWKLAVIVQQIYYRYAEGFTQDARFAGMLDTVRLLAREAAAAVADPSRV